MPTLLDRAVQIVLLGAIVGCGEAPRPALDFAVVAHPSAIDSVPPDSHVLDLSDGTEVWLTEGRMGRSAAGAPCRERGVQLRNGDRRVTVPLLYTLAQPVVADGKLVASLATACASGEVYTIDAVTGQPSKLGRRSK